MNLNSKFIAIAVVAASFINVANYPAFSHDMKKMGKSTKMKHEEHKMTMSKEMMDRAMETAENNKNLMMMGMKMIDDGNKDKDADKMLKGAKMMHISMMTMHMGMMHMKMMDKKSQDAMMSKMHMDKKMMDDIHKAVAQKGAMLMGMGNSIMKDANKAGDGDKMMKGAELVHAGMMMHMSMMDDKMKDHHEMEEMMEK